MKWGEYSRKVYARKLEEPTEILILGEVAEARQGEYVCCHSPELDADIWLMDGEEFEAAHKLVEVLTEFTQQKLEQLLDSNAP